MTFADPSLIGEAFVGEGANAAHVNVVLGRKGGPVETAWATALATPRQGYIPFVVILRPNLPVKPLTLFVNKADLRGERHETLTWGAAQAGVARGVAQAVAESVIPADEVDALLLIAAAWVSWEADDDEVVYGNNAEATLGALRAAAERRPRTEDVLGARDAPGNPFFTPR
ncbi:MAG: formaldehyde-activating enzyme [Actinomycetota bacterium]|nr:formaldehyde-activating enzyme [Actinomycetota bacterium]